MIRAAIYFKDRELTGRVSDALASSHAGILPLTAKEQSFDVIVTDSEDVAAAYAPFAVLVERPLSVTALIPAVYEASMRHGGRVNILANRSGGKSGIVLFCSPEGGAGCTTAAVALCRELRRYRSRQVCYINLEPFGSETKYFSGDTERFLYFIEKTKYRQPIPDEFLLSDLYGVRATPTGGRYNELLLKTSDEFSQTINLLSESGFDDIIVDAGTAMNENILNLANTADAICLLMKEEPVIRAEKMCAYLEEHVHGMRERLIKIRNFVRSEFAVDDGKDEQAGEDILLEYDRVLATEDAYIDGAFGLGIKEIANLLPLRHMAFTRRSEN